MTENSVKIEEVALDPRWEVGMITFDEIKFVLFTLMHPRHGRIDVLLPTAAAASLGPMLLQASTYINEERGK